MVIIIKCNLIYKKSLQYAFDRCFTYQYFDFVYPMLICNIFYHIPNARHII